jgi:hypothetical protein
MNLVKINGELINEEYIVSIYTLSNEDEETGEVACTGFIKYHDGIDIVVADILRVSESEIGDEENDLSLLHMNITEEDALEALESFVIAEVLNYISDNVFMLGVEK